MKTPKNELPSVIKESLTTLINNYIRIEKEETGLAYQQKVNFVRGQIDIVTQLMNENWVFYESGQSYYAFLKYLVEKYELSVWRIDDLLVQ